MIFKTLKHKKHPDLFGYIESSDGYDPFISTSDIPLLQPETATIELEIEYLKSQGMFNLADYILENYEMVTVKIEVI